MSSCYVIVDQVEDQPLTKGGRGALFIVFMFQLYAN